MKKIEDYLSLYLGCQMYRGGTPNEKLTGIKFYGPDGLNLEYADGDSYHFDIGKCSHKPILRSVEDITEDELHQLLLDVLDSPELKEMDADLIKEEIFLGTVKEDSEGPYLVVDFSCRCLEGYFKISTINGDIYMYDEQDYDDNENNVLRPISGQAEIVRKLLLQGFDLFGLIDANLAYKAQTAA